MSTHTRLVATLAAGVAALLLAPVLSAQKLELKLDHLKAKATESAEVDLEGPLLDTAKNPGLLKQFGVEELEKSEAVKRALAGLKGVFVRHYEFAKPGEYTDADFESVVKQVRGVPDWARLVSVKDKDERVEIHLMTKGDEALGALIVVAEPKEFTVVNITGALTAEMAKELVTSQIHYDLSKLR